MGTILPNPRRQKGAYYNDSDKYVCRWLENLISAGHIAPGDVDCRSIHNVTPSDLEGYTQCHFFAGIGVWSYALRAAGWPDDRPVWTGSCPCQPFGGAGTRGGFDDDRHLWPIWLYLIRKRRPGVILGEQVASKDGLGWWDLVSSDLENTDYPCAAIDTCVPGVGGPHIRQRLYWMAYDHRVARGQGRAIDGGCGQGGHAQPWSGSGSRGEPVRLADRDYTRLEIIGQQPAWVERAAVERGRAALRLGHTEGQPGRLPDGSGRLADPQSIGSGEACRPGPLNGFWRDADWLGCIDARWRPVEPGTFPLAHGAASRVGRLRAYGNAINAKQAQQFIEAVRETLDA